ncbi:MAG: hypothetical protein ACRDGU_02295 [Actinomycetota bacterium]
MNEPGLNPAVCPVCGFPDLSEVPWVDESPSDEICPSCGAHFGYDDVAGGDAALRQQIHRRLREEWKVRGCTWFSTERPPPPGWDPSAQLAVVGDGG